MKKKKKKKKKKKTIIIIRTAADTLRFRPDLILIHRTLPMEQVKGKTPLQSAHKRKTLKKSAHWGGR